jgi:dipeptide transport system permease protein
MLRLIVSRLALMVPALLGVVLLSFALIHLVPGDPIEVRRGERGIAPQELAILRHQMGLDRPLPVQLLDYVGQVARGDLGLSIATRRPVLEEFLTLLPATVELSLCAMLLAIAIGLPAGIVAATRRGSALDHGLMGAALTGYSMPIFWWGLLLILLFSVALGWTPVSGRISDLYDVPRITGFMLIDALFSSDEGAWISAVSHLVLPTIVLATYPLAMIARITRSAMLEVLSEDYIRTARAKGLSRARIVGVHALRNALIPIVTVIGLYAGTLLAGAILTETIFSWPGIGKWLVDSVARRDYPVLQGGVLLVAAIVMSVNLLVDLAYGALDPRVRRRS